MHLIPILAFTAPANGSALDDMLRLIGIAAVVLAFFKGIKSLIANPSKQAVPQRPAPSAPAPTEDFIDPEIIAAISAAITSFTGHSHRVVSIKHTSSAWEKAGRQSLLSSHRIR